MTLRVDVRRTAGAFTLEAAFEAPPGVTALFGRSGAGKTTIVNAVAGLARPDAGRISLGERVLYDSARRIWVPPARRQVGYVFQEGRLFPHLNVRANLLFGRRFLHRRARGGVEVDNVIEMLGLEALLQRRPGALSGGEKQRVAIGRALLRAPQLLLMDEPLAALDEARKAEILPYIERLRDAAATPILYVSHSLPEVARLADRVVALSDGRVALCGPTEDVFADPALFPITGRQQAGSVLSAVVAAHDPADGLTELSVSGGRLFAPLISAAPGTRLRVRVRARDVTLAIRRPEGLSAQNLLPCVVESLQEEQGPVLEASLICGADRLRARVTRRAARELALEPGVACWAVLKSVAVTRRDVGAFGRRDL